MQFAAPDDRKARHKNKPPVLAEQVYQRLKQDIFDFRLLPGDRFTENELAERLSVSRTPIRQALFRLETEGFVSVYYRSGWQVKPFDFAYFEELYDLRIVLEREAVQRLCLLPPDSCAALLQPLHQYWIDEPRQDDGQQVSRQDETFHLKLVAAAGNREMARVHRDVTEKIRIIRRLDFTRQDRIQATYQEHAAILQAILAQDSEQACRLLAEHIAGSKAEVRNITLHLLQQARNQAAI
ncbi:GntR family transcriptional regulator [Dickeya dadantii]|uniref:GntR family transcriptional regulator n=1 Tax=Dickeya dadantii TaxID=204038 RepID=UPI0014961B2D|nr:GntR family transcriptional regulator [Dickeya dadantii]NPE60567.1 GntR family transcriptional regulator [Dickeya dadantii]NPE70418.1 GntR family transcriptional regulator [Dickeya dadantii]